MLSRRRTEEPVWQKKGYPSMRFVWVVVDNGLCIGFGESTSNQGQCVKVSSRHKTAYIHPNWVILAKQEVLGKELRALSQHKYEEVIRIYSGLQDRQIHVSIFANDRDYRQEGADKRFILDSLNKQLRLEYK